MARPKKIQPDIQSPSVGSNVPPKAERDSVTLQVQKRTENGPLVGYKRTYSREQHGDDFEAIAHSFKERFGAVEV